MILSKELDRRHLVLVVEDQEINRDVLGVILEDDYDVIYASNGVEAMEAIYENRNRLSIILLDLIMPVMDGYEVLRRLKEDRELKQIPVIVLTAEKAAELRALQAGAADFITKPFDMHEVILARVSRIIELSEGQQLIHAAERDHLTNLYTRSFFFEYAERIYRYHPDWHMDAIILDIDRFHSVNELNGREFGDTVLRVLGSEIISFLSETNGIAGRIEADRFNIFCKHREDKDYNGILRRFQTRLNTLSEHASIRLRMGVKPYREGVEPTLMFDRARVACNMVRDNYKTHLMIFDEDMREQELHQQKLLSDLRQAIDERQFVVYYQPKYDIQSAQPRLVSAEALIRWKHPELGMVAPGDFVPLFENNGLVHIVDDYVCKTAASQIAHWREDLGFVLPLSVNLSRTDIFDPMLESNLVQLMRDNGLDPRDMKLEVTESAYTDNAKELISVIERLRVDGFQIEMDDFGSGYSSLNMLSTLPIDVLKMDMKFIQNVSEDSKNFRMVELILDIAKFLKVPVIAEGVETAEQVEMLREAGCDIVQGFFFSRPLPAEEFEKLIQKEIALNRGAKAMTVPELYELVGGNYDHALQIMKKDKMIHKYVLKLNSGEEMEHLRAAAETLDYAQMFEMAHDLKGISDNLGFEELSAALCEITDELGSESSRSHSDEELRAMVQKAEGLYKKTSEGINQYEDSLR